MGQKSERTLNFKKRPVYKGISVQGVLIRGVAMDCNVFQWLPYMITHYCLSLWSAVEGDRYNIIADRFTVIALSLNKLSTDKNG